MSVNTQTTILNLFESIYNLILQVPKSGKPALKALPKRIEALYNVDVEEMLILAYLVHYYPEKRNYRQLQRDLSGDVSRLDNIIKALCRKGFLAFSNGDATEIDNVYLRGDAYEAFTNQIEYGFACYPDIVAALKKYGCSIALDKAFSRSFSHSLALESNKTFREGLEQLNVQKYTPNGQKAFWTIVRQFITTFVKPLVFCEEDLLEEGDAGLKEGLCELEKEGVVISFVTNNEDGDDGRDSFVLSPKVAGLLFRGRENLLRYNYIAKYAIIMANKNIAECPLYFSEDVQQEINDLGKMLSPEGYKKCQAILAKQHRNPALVGLLWGPSGTGKTEAVKQLAKHSGRDVIFFDVSKVTASNWGATEKLYRAVFLAYAYIANISENVPILLMNEADAILAKRLTSIERSIDKAENTVTNILLQEFEDFNGILLATTNLIDNLDPAFDRRFLFKTQIQKPDVKARYRIWKSNVSELTDEEAHQLARGFEMSGGQIFNVATRRNLAELYYDGERGLAYIQDLCRKELSTEKGSASSRKRIGF